MQIHSTKCVCNYIANMLHENKQPHHKVLYLVWIYCGDRGLPLTPHIEIYPL